MLVKAGALVAVCRCGVRCGRSAVWCALRWWCHGRRRGRVVWPSISPCVVRWWCGRYIGIGGVVVVAWWCVIA